MKIILSPIHPAGWPFIGICAFVTFLFFLFSGVLGLLALAVTAWCVYFFRLPQRVTPSGQNLIISPADGILVKIEKAAPPKELKAEQAPLTRLSIFLNVFDVHVNRIPIEGVIQKIAYHAGKFFNASLDKASEFNERNSVVIKTPMGPEITVVQIAGLIARRIVCDVQKGQTVSPGETYGIIRFGSRVDIYLPDGVVPEVLEGQRMIGGETILGRLPEPRSSKSGKK